MPIAFNKVSHIYNPGTTFSYVALDQLSLDIKEGSFTAIIGETGSGKTTLVQHLNALLLPTEGELQVLDRMIKAHEKPKHLKELRHRVGLVFQFPEYQLFEETILKDICFGPKNFGVVGEEAVARAKSVLKIVGLDDSYLEKSPFNLSGGQKRRIAIAGILAMEPEVLVLDEPTAGLDPQGAIEMMNLFKEMNEHYKKTVLIVTHDMEHVLNYCEEVIVIHDGKLCKQCSVGEFFTQVELLEELKINPPAIIALREALRKSGLNINEHILDMDTLAKAVAKEVKG